VGARERGHDRRPERIGEGESHHEIARLDEAHARVGGDLRQQGGDDETLDPDGKGAEREPEEAAIHGGDPCSRLVEQLSLGTLLSRKSSSSVELSTIRG
jgi:hypothetical protein